MFPALRVTAGFFDVLRMRPALGRAFTSDNEIDGRHRVVVLSDGLWRRRFGGNPDIVGRTIAFDDGAYEVVGIMPPERELGRGVHRWSCAPDRDPGPVRYSGGRARSST